MSLVVFIHIVAALFTIVYLKHTYILEPTVPFLCTYCGLQVCIPLYLSQYTWLLIVDSSPSSQKLPESTHQVASPLP